VWYACDLHATILTAEFPRTSLPIASVARADRQNRIRLILVTARLFLLFAGQLIARFLSYADPSLTSGRVRGQAFRDAVTRADPCGGFA